MTMVRPINQELYFLNRPISITESEEDLMNVRKSNFDLFDFTPCLTRRVVIQDVLSGYSILYNCHPVINRAAILGRTGELDISVSSITTTHYVDRKSVV